MFLNVFFVEFSLIKLIFKNIITPTIEEHLIKEQAGFRPGKSCTSNLLNGTQHIDDGYQEGKITGTAFVDLSVAYDTVNYRFQKQKLYNTTQHSTLCRVIQNLLSNRSFYVELNEECGRWIKQNNGMLLLLLFAMIRSVVKSFKVPDVEVAAARMSNESALTRMTDSTPKKPWSDLTLVLDG